MKGISRRWGLSLDLWGFGLSLVIKQRRDLPIVRPRLYVWREGVELRLFTRLGAIQRDPVPESSKMAS